MRDAEFSEILSYSNVFHTLRLSRIHFQMAKARAHDSSCDSSHGACQAAASINKEERWRLTFIFTAQQSGNKGGIVSVAQGIDSV